MMAAQYEAEVREFAGQYPGPNARRMIALCEAGTIGWAEAYEVARAALAKGLATVA
jgi:hypothetical protein